MSALDDILRSVELFDAPLESNHCGVTLEEIAAARAELAALRAEVESLKRRAEDAELCYHTARSFQPWCVDKKLGDYTPGAMPILTDEARKALKESK